MRLSLFGILLVCTGCVSIPKTEQELRNNHYQIVEKCIDAPLAEAYEVIASNTARCHGGADSLIMPAGGVFIPVTAKNQIAGTISKDQANAKVTVEHINPVNSGFLQLIELYKTDACPTNIKVYLLNDSKKWETATKSVFQWVQGNETNCFEL
ncbi:hypothetical protein ACJJJB_02495 [Microbulbifer sp. ANSA001]|uniref:hypothetical protein n=1 Tax=Microbulbifer sp. ANSA001 TaxID=3243358 RepID=UPI0012FCAB81